MNLLETIIAVLLIIMFVTTAITEPALTIKYCKAYATSGIHLFIKTKDFFTKNVHHNNSEVANHEKQNKALQIPK